LIRSISLLQLSCPLRIQNLLIERLLRLTRVVQEVDVVLVHVLRRLTQRRLVDTKLTLLRTQRTQTGRNLLTNPKLLTSQRTRLTRQIAVQTGRIPINASRALTQLRLLHAQLTQPLTSSNLLIRQTSILRCSTLPQLRLLNRLLPEGLANVRKLTRTLQPKLRFLRLHPRQSLTRLKSQLRLLSRQSTDRLTSLQSQLTLLPG
jgi:hypothetical protein